MYAVIHPSAHFLLLIWDRVTVALGYVRKLRLRPPVPPAGSQGLPRPEEICSPSSVFWVCLGVFDQLDVTKNTSRGRRLEGIRCQNCLSWILSMLTFVLWAPPRELYKTHTLCDWWTNICRVDMEDIYFSRCDIGLNKRRIGLNEVTLSVRFCF